MLRKPTLGVASVRQVQERCSSSTDHHRSAVRSAAGSQRMVRWSVSIQYQLP